MKALIEALKALGVTPVLVQGYTNNSQDFTPIVLAIKKSGADILATYMTNSPDVGIFAKQMRQLGVNMPWVGSPSIISVTALNLAGEALYGTYAIADFTTDADEQSTERSPRSIGTSTASIPTRSRAGRTTLCTSLPSPFKKANSTDAEAVRKGILGINGYKGVEGNLRLRPERRRFARLQCRQERRREDRFHQARRISPSVSKLRRSHRGNPQ